MLDEKDLQAISQLLAQQRNDMIQEIDARFGSYAQEMDARFSGYAQEMDTRFSGYAQEMDTRFSGYTQEMGVRFGGYAQEMDTRFGGLREEMDTRFAQQKSEMMHEVRLLMESYFDPKFNYLADCLELLKEKAVGREELEETSDRLDVLEAVVKVHSREIGKLKKAQ